MGKNRTSEDLRMGARRCKVGDLGKEGLSYKDWAGRRRKQRKWGQTVVF